eukprot:scaffold11036_cov68-Cyclotella_meneghiniana.AAC.2
MSPNANCGGCFYPLGFGGDWQELYTLKEEVFTPMESLSVRTATNGVASVRDSVHYQPFPNGLLSTYLLVPDRLTAMQG